MGDAVVVGLGAMLGAGVFAAFGPAARAAGSGLVWGLVLAGLVAWCNATSSAQLAAAYPQSGGTYVYGRRLLGRTWGVMAGWAFLSGKTASCAAMALTFAAYVAPEIGRPLAVGAVMAVTAVNVRGIQRTATVTRLVVVVVFGVLAVVAAASLFGGTARLDRLDLWSSGNGGVQGILQAGGLLFFAFAGYARIATLGEEVVDPARTISRAIPLALGLTLAVYTVVGASALAAIGADGLADATAPLAAAVGAGDLASLVPVVRVGAAVASLGVLLALVAGVGRTAFAMAADGELPAWLATIDDRHRVPARAELVVAAAVVAVVAVADVRGAIGFSSCNVLAYYAITNAAALRLRSEERRWPPALAVGGLVGCTALALSLPLASVVAGLAILALGAAVFVARQR
ncbi:MAG TPA: APC family permease [Acidimicrobiales bacterium]|nr:APC family permease [Acidimicrobiales bacterium]